MRGSGLAAAFAAALAFGVSGCAAQTTDYQRAMAEAHRASSAGRFGEAAEAYRRAGTAAAAPLDRDRAALLSALEKARAGEVARALAELDTLAKAAPATGTSAEAAFKAASLRLRTGSEAQGLRDLESFVVSSPESTFALPALAHVLRHKEAAGAEAARSYLAGLAARAPEDSALGQRIAYERALRTESKAAKRDALLRVAARYPYPKGAYWDDALFRASELEEELGRPKEAIALLERLLAERETSDVMGSYHRPRYSPAKLRIATLQEGLGERDAARRTLHELFRDFKHSDLRDDALWREAKLFREDHQTAESCDRLATLVQELRDSRYVPCAVSLCPTIARPKASRAPTSCHAYLLDGRKQGAPESSDTPARSAP